MTREAASPISFKVNVARLPKKGMPVVIEPDEAQRDGLAAEHDLLSIDRFRAELMVTDWKRGGVKVAGRVQAAVTQSCVVTLEPVADTIDEGFTALYLPEGSKLALPQGVDGEIVLDAEGPDAPELFSGDWIDVGQLVEEYFALGIDPYPRKPGVALPQAETEVAEDRGPLFDKLRALKKKP